MPHHEDHGQAFCLLCRRMIAVSQVRDELMGYVGLHISADHNEVHVAIEGQHFLIEPAPWRCDLCGAVVELPVWTYYTAPGIAQDASWLVCDGCSELVESNQVTSLLKRIMQGQLATNVGTRENVMTVTFPMARRFLEYRVGTRERVEG